MWTMIPLHIPCCYISSPTLVLLRVASMEEETQAHCRSQYVKAREQTAHQVRKLGSAHSYLQGALQQQRRKERELEELRAELAQLDRTRRQFEEEAQKEGAPRGVTVELAEAQVGVRVGENGGNSAAGCCQH